MPMPNLKPVVSSNIDAVGYDNESNKLYVRFKSTGAVYEYPGVTPALAEVIENAESPGKAFHANITGKFHGAKVQVPVEEGL